MPLMQESDSVSRAPRRKGQSANGNPVTAFLPESFFTEMRAKPHRTVVSDYRWAHDNRLEYESMVAQWDGKGEGKSWERIYQLLKSAPGNGAINLLWALLNDDKDSTLKEVMKQLAKGDDEEEDAKRERDARTRFSVIGRLLDVGRPVPAWLDQKFTLDEGVVS